MVKLLELCENLKIEVENLKAEKEALRMLKERLSLNSKNSSIPSSKELYKIKKDKQKSKRNIGGQVGHLKWKVVKVEFLRMWWGIHQTKSYVVEYQLKVWKKKK